MSTHGIDPHYVDSPRKNWRTVRILHWEKGDSPEYGGYSVAIGTWDNLDGSGPRPVVGVRWNGSETHKIGNPQSRGLPTWFAMPDKLAEAVVNATAMADSDRAFALEFLRNSSEMR